MTWMASVTFSLGSLKAVPGAAHGQKFATAHCDTTLCLTSSILGAVQREQNPASATAPSPSGINKLQSSATLSSVALAQSGLEQTNFVPRLKLS
jgi:hypothetical protein